MGLIFLPSGNIVIYIYYIPFATKFYPSLPAAEYGVAVFRPAKMKWKDILDTWLTECWCSDNLPTKILPSLLAKLVRHLIKSTNLVSDFLAGGLLWPLDGNHVLKRSPNCNDTSNVNKFSSNKSVLTVLKEN